MMSIELKTLVKKNFLCAWRSKELLIDAAVVTMISFMLVFKASLGSLTGILPLLFSVATCPTVRSVLIQMVDEKAKKFKEI